MTKKIKLIAGVFALVLATGLNVRHALNNYGVKGINMHVEALERTSETCFARIGGEKGMPMGIEIQNCSCISIWAVRAVEPSICREIH